MMAKHYSARFYLQRLSPVGGTSITCAISLVALLLFFGVSPLVVIHIISSSALCIIALSLNIPSLSWTSFLADLFFSPLLKGPVRLMFLLVIMFSRRGRH